MFLRVQGPKQGTGTTIAITLDSAPVNGNILVLTFGAKGASGAIRTIASIAQTGVTWTLQIRSQYATGLIDSEIWLGIVGANASADLTVTEAGGSISGCVADVCEYSVGVPSGFLDKTAIASGTSTTLNTGTTEATTQNVELWIGAGTTFGVNHINPTNGFSELDGIAVTGVCISYMEKIVSSTGTANCSETISNTNWAGCIAAFKLRISVDRFQQEGSDFRETKFGATW